MNSKDKQKELRKIKNAYAWISWLSNIEEFQYDEDAFYKQLERVYKNLDTRVVLWALNSYKDELKNTLTGKEKSHIRLTNRERMIALLLDGSEDKEKTLKRALSIEIDDGGSSEEAMIHYHIGCPYCKYKDCMLKEDEEPNRETCVKCKAKWLDKKVDY